MRDSAWNALFKITATSENASNASDKAGQHDYPQKWLYLRFCDAVDENTPFLRALIYSVTKACTMKTIAQ